jgi:hypothetical protein
VPHGGYRDVSDLKAPSSGDEGTTAVDESLNGSQVQPSALNGHAQQHHESGRSEGLVKPPDEVVKPPEIKLPDVEPPKTKSHSIVTGKDLGIRIKFFGSIVGMMAIDAVVLILVLAVIIGGHWVAEYPKEWFPDEVHVVELAEIVLLGATGLCVLWYVVLDVWKTMRRTWEVMYEEGDT